MSNTTHSNGQKAADSLVEPLEKTTIQDAGPLGDTAQASAAGSGHEGVRMNSNATVACWLSLHVLLQFSCHWCL